MSKGELLTLWTATRPLIWVLLWEASASLSLFRLVSSSNESNTKIKWLLIECFDSYLQLCFCVFRSYQSRNVIFDLVLGQCSCCCLHFRFCPSSLEWFEYFFSCTRRGRIRCREILLGQPLWVATWSRVNLLQSRCTILRLKGLL